ncbi:hypothetical protein EVAR_72965_1 [Eumeta japonica]|uniref:Uncharacterized protein n=1 Tax=Eumeta variegata TaxID=151549 RepID=A0A4C1T6N7_EUMVA|nr:hypothetical protein EVAR_72965_1 [Eumeta japonica]
MKAICRGGCARAGGARSAPSAIVSSIQFVFHSVSFPRARAICEGACTDCFPFNGPIIRSVISANITGRCVPRGCLSSCSPPLPPPAPIVLPTHSLRDTASFIARAPSM